MDKGKTLFHIWGPSDTAELVNELAGQGVPGRAVDQTEEIDHRSMFVD